MLTGLISLLKDISMDAGKSTRNSNEQGFDNHMLISARDSVNTNIMIADNDLKIVYINDT